MLLLTLLGLFVAYEVTGIEATSVSGFNNRKQHYEEPWLDPFLPDYIIPLHYHLWLYPQFYFTGNRYQGQVAIDLQILQPTDVVIVHIKQMTVTWTSLRDHTGAIIPLISAFPHDRNEYWVAQAQQSIAAGRNVTLILEFGGLLTNGIVGFYKSTYRHDVTGVESWLATSKFQPSDARKAFPNFDEPRFKSQFTITMRHWSNFTATSNMPAERTVQLDSVWSETTFQTTPPMSSYLVCFVVHDFAYKSNILQDGIPHRIWARPDRIDQVDYALGVAQVMQDYFVNLFEVPFPLPKLDQLGIPDYPSGATEHWGIVTYRDTRLLYDPEQVSDYDKQRVLSIVAHELAHNHHGDLVTCQSWEELWLNEGFATYYSFKGMTHADSSMYAEGQFFTRTMQSIMRSDSSNSSRPIVVKITTPDEANAAFDAVAYDKAASMLSMMEGFLGTPLFNRAITRYLVDNSFQSVVSDDLWEAMQKEVGPSLNMKQIMSPWIYSMGYPVIEISRLPGNRLEAKQRRFLTDPSSDPDSPPTEYGYKWYVPLKYRTKAGATGMHWLNATDLTFDNPVSSDLDWIKFNYDHTGFYRVNYPTDMWTSIADQLSTNFKEFTDLERANLLSDALSLSRAAQLSYDFSLDLTKYLSDEEDFLPWDSIGSPLSYIGAMFSDDTNDYLLWQEYMIQITHSLMDKLQIIDAGTHVEKLTRTNLIRLTCSNDYAPCLTNTTVLFTAWIVDSELYPVPNNLKREVYAYGMRGSGDEEAWNTLWDRYVSATSGQEQDNLLYALSNTDNLVLIDRLLEYAMDPTKIRSQDFFTTISYVSSSANSHLWQWMQVNYEAIVARFGLDNRSLGRMVPGIVSDYNTQEQLEEVEAFYARYPDAGTGERFREESLQSIRANIRWVATNMQTIRDWLNNNVEPLTRG